MALDDTIPADGNGVTNGVKISQLAGHIRQLKSDLNNGKLSIIGDDDGDTRIDVEETANENIIHFYTDGSESIRILSNGNLYTGGEAIEINALNSGDRNSYIDFHSDDTNTDYSARIRRYPGVNGNLEIKNVGTGEIHFITAGSERVKIDNNGHVLIGNPDYNTNRYLIVRNNISVIHENTSHYGYIDFWRSDGKRGAYIGWGNGDSEIEFYPDDATEIKIGREYGWLKIKQSPGTNTFRGFAQASDAGWKNSGEAYKTFAIAVSGNNIYLYWVDSSGNYRQWTTSGTVL